MAAKIKSYFLLGALSVLLVYIGSLFGNDGMIIAFLIALAMNLISYFVGDKIVLSMTRAVKVSESQMPELHRIVSEVSVAAGIPKPDIYIIPSESPNAFATGRDPSHSSVAFTQGILDLLDVNELKGVIAHEMSHIKNRDILIATISATIASAITMIARMIQFAAMFGGSRDSNRGGNIFSVFAMLAFAILVPIAAALINLAISRNREYFADETGAKIIHNPFALAEALKKLARGVSLVPMNNANPSTSHLFIVNPFSSKSFLALFSTHPPLEERIRRLENMSF
ncbi:MAG: zinc metalloprotease HtpX [Candidatus Omnitrophica bacterium]|nr:zinc metalloprotease HtpX [Candidatus Omnitrophota bacterium]MCM8788389.1 zinc metalloprotease HtpX [Candidatus Omnitrophota bacterium]